MKYTYRDSIVGILTVRLSEEEERLLALRSKRAGMKKASYVRKLIRDQPFETAADVLADLQTRLGNQRLGMNRK